MTQDLTFNAISSSTSAQRSHGRGACRDLVRDWARWTAGERVAACALAALIASAVPAGILAMAIHTST
jgi:hypothetical protein